jgi:Cu+-exporting ATPase
MTCASCAARIEKKLNKVDGVEATVNFATEQATVHCDPAVPVAALIGAVDSAGYTARVSTAAHGHDHDEPARVLWRRLVVAIVLSVPIVLLAMVPPLRFSGWDWVALVLSAPVVF